VLAVDDPNSKVYFRNIPKTCGACHGDSDIILSEGLSAAPVDKYSQSVHGHMLEDPDSEPAVCTACHGSHEIVRANDPTSMINPFKISATCGSCHQSEAEEYQGSVHGVAFQHGVSASPVCTDCHGIHSIKVVVHDDASTREQHLVRTTCPACHASEAIMGEYGVARARVATYEASYHGLAHTRGSKAVADCASCHGIHAIYPSTDARSSVAPQNLQETCGHCHPNAGEEFVRSPVHYDDQNLANTDVVITTWVKRIYYALILVVIGGMIVHNAIIMFPYIRQKLRSEQRERGRPRFSRSQMIQHSLLFTTFFLLVFSGFMLAYPNTWWSEMLVGLGITESIRRWVHRIAALGMIAVSAYHLVWLFSSPYGRGELKRIAPGLRDVREFRQNMLFHLGLSKQQAGFAKFDYPAKMEYWALVWGTIIMALTGVILWFPVWATSFMPFWILKVAEVVHLFEAWLATLAIVIFHFFYVMGHPSIYPLNLAMFHGRMDPELAEHHHPGWTPDGDPQLRSNGKTKATMEESERKDTVQV
jgi:cytochrome b subunit of formate dehydrogenase